MSVVIPAYNEDGSIRAVIDGFFATGLVDEVVVIDNNALGNTNRRSRRQRHGSSKRRSTRATGLL